MKRGPRSRRSPSKEYCVHTLDGGYCCTSPTSRGKWTCDRHGDSLSGPEMRDRAPMSDSRWMRQHMSAPGRWAQEMRLQMQIENQAREQAKEIAMKMYPNNQQKVEEVIGKILRGAPPNKAEIATALAQAALDTDSDAQKPTASATSPVIHAPPLPDFAKKAKPAAPVPAPAPAPAAAAVAKPPSPAPAPAATPATVVAQPKVAPVAAAATPAAPSVNIAELTKKLSEASQKAAIADAALQAKAILEEELTKKKDEIAVVMSEKAVLSNSIAKLEAEITDKNKEIANLAANCAKQSTAACIDNAAAGAMTAEIDRLKQDLAEAEKLKDEATQKQSQIETQKQSIIDALKKKVSDAESERDDSRRNHAGDVQRMEGQYKQLEAGKLAVEQNRDSLDAQLKADQAKYQKSLDDLALEVSNKDKEIGMLQAEVAAKTQEVKDLTSQITAGQQTSASSAAALQAQLTAKVSELSIAQARISQLENEVQTLQTQEASVKSQLATAEQEISTLGQEKTSAISRIGAIKVQLAAVNAELTTANSQISQLNDNVKDLNGQVAAAKSDLAAADQKIVNLERDIEDLTKKLKVCNDELNDAKRVNNQLQIDKAGLTAERTRLDGEVAALTAEKTQLVADNGSLTTDKANLIALKATLESEKNQLRVDIANVESEKKKLEGEKKDAENEAQRLAAEITSLNAAGLADKQALAQAKLDLKAKETEIAEKEAYILAKESVIAQNTVKISDLQVQVGELQTQLSEEQNRGSTCNTKLVKLSADLQKVQEDRDILSQKLQESDANLISKSSEINRLGLEQQKIEAAYTAEKEKVTQANTDIKDLKAEITALKGAVQICNEAKATMKQEDEERVRVLDENVARIQEDIERKTKELEVITKEKETAEKALDQAREKLTEINAELSQASATHKADEAKVQELTDKIAVKEKDIESLNDRIAKIENERDAEMQSKNTFAEEVAKEKQEVADLKKVIGEMGARITELTARLKESEEPKPCSDTYETYMDILDLISGIIEYGTKVREAAGKISNETIRETALHLINANLQDVGRLSKQYLTVEIANLMKQGDLQQLRDPSYCQELAKYVQSWVSNSEVAKIISIRKALLNIFEDNIGAVRVYVRVKLLRGSAKKANIQPSPEKAEISVEGVPKPYGPFYSVFSDDYDNVGVFTGVKGGDGTDLSTPDDNVQGLHSIFSQVRDGYTAVLFGYGLSGSGKSYTLFGSKANSVPGIIQIGVSHFGFSVSVNAILELYVGGSTNHNGIRGNLHMLHAMPESTGKIRTAMRMYTEAMVYPPPPEVLINETFAYDNFAKAHKLDYKKRLDQKTINDLVEVTDLYRREESRKRVKATPLNPESSRSHLIYIFKMDSDGAPNAGYLIVMDMAGKEDPNQFKKLFFTDHEKMTMGTLMTPGAEIKGMPVTNFIATPTKSVDGTAKYVLKDVLFMLKEGIYINETIFQLSSFLVRQSGKKIVPKAMDVAVKETQDATLDKKVARTIDYSPYGAMANPNTECDMLDELYKGESVQPITSRSVTCMLPVLYMLKKWGTGRSTKFVMICNVRQEKEFLEQTVNTLSFANTVKST